MTPGSSEWRAQYWGPGCNKDGAIITAYWMIGGPKIQCHKNSIRVWRALGRIQRKHGYQVRPGVTGCYNCRAITGGTSLSAHAQGIALDENWDTNPYRTDRVITDMPPDMVHEMQMLENDAGVRAVRWGGDWDGRPETKNSNYDAMHWEVICTPQDVKIGFSIPAFSEDDQRMWPLLDLNEKGGAVAQLQMHLKASNIDVVTDGYFGPNTQAAVKEYQLSRGLPADGLVGLGTWTSLFTNHPVIAAGETTTHKGQGAVG